MCDGTLHGGSIEGGGCESLNITSSSSSSIAPIEEAVLR